MFSQFYYECDYSSINDMMHFTAPGMVKEIFIKMLTFTQVKFGNFFVSIALFFFKQNIIR